MAMNTPGPMIDSGRKIGGPIPQGALGSILIGIMNISGCVRFPFFSQILLIFRHGCNVNSPAVLGCVAVCI
jgi:hypothetical protein